MSPPRPIPRRIVVVGCGGWGARIVQRLSRLGDIDVAPFDTRADRAGSVAAATGGRAASGELSTMLRVLKPDAVVIATPPETHASVLADVLACGVRCVRVEKPLAVSADQAQWMITACESNGAELTVGFTLLHHLLFEAAFAFVKGAGGAEWVRAVRTGRGPGHACSAQLDLGIHAASVAAHLGVPCDVLIARHIPANLRLTQIGTLAGPVLVNEITATIQTPTRTFLVRDDDALGRDLAAWIDGRHRGTSDVALRAQQEIEERR